MKVNFAGVTDTFEPLPEGTYDAVLVKYEILTSKTSNAPYVKFEFVITEDEYQGRKQWRNYSLQPKAYWALKRTFVALGVDPELLNEEFELEEVLEELLNEECRLKLTHREYDGKTFDNVEEVLSSSMAV